jgi:uncharacterized membrane protein
VDITADLIRTAWLWPANLLYGATLLVALRRAPWRWLRNTADLNIWLAVCLTLVLVWSMRASLEVGAHLHFLGAMLLTLMFGWYFALIGMALVMLGAAALGHLDWLSLGLNGLLMSAIPISFSYLVFLLVEWRLPHNFFIYIFVTAFWGAALSMALTALTSTLMLAWASELTWSELRRGYLPFGLLLSFPEGFVTGFLMSIFVVYRPEWVYTFRDEKYLKGK